MTQNKETMYIATAGKYYDKDNENDNTKSKECI